MKLYTEEEIVSFLKKEFADEIDAETFMKNLTPIELPSDKDTSHLQWMYDRMSNIHGENENYDYMLKFKEIIEQLKKGGNK